MLTIEPVQTPRQWREFRQVPWRVYRDDPHWVPTPGPTDSTSSTRPPSPCCSERG